MRYLPVLLFALSSCTYSVNQVHTEGTATDVIDEDQKATSDVSPNLAAPLPA